MARSRRWRSWHVLSHSHRPAAALCAAKILDLVSAQSHTSAFRLSPRHTRLGRHICHFPFPSYLSLRFPLSPFLPSRVSPFEVPGRRESLPPSSLSPIHEYILSSPHIFCAMRPPPPPPPLFALALFAHATAATFTLSHPLPFGSESTSQSQAPCGASPLLLQSTTGFYVGGDAVAVVSEGDGASILIRATISEDLGKANWTNLFPVVQQQGGGKFCEPLVLAPEEWAGREGVVQVIESGEEGLSYQVGLFYFVSSLSILSIPYLVLLHTFILYIFLPRDEVRSVLGCSLILPCLACLLSYIPIYHSETSN